MSGPVRALALCAAFGLAAVLTFGLATAAEAQALSSRPVPRAVPEIDATAGLAALAAVLAAVALVWERRRRRS